MKRNKLFSYIIAILLLVVGLIVILSQSFAVNNGLGVAEILSGILNQSLWHLECNISKEAVKVSYEAMSGKSMEEI